MRFLLLLLLLPASVQAQVTLGRQVICPLALSGSGSFLLQSTVGQVETRTLQVDSLTLTQGFQQPDQHPMTLSVAMEWPLCDDGTGGTLTVANVGGCASGSPLIYWEGELLEGNVITGLETGTYNLQIVSGPGCILNVEYPVVAPELPSCDLSFFNTITPNNDGHNDTWVIANIQGGAYNGNTVRIINRWGAEVWSASNYNNEDVVFAGRNQDGQELAAGTYYYVVQAGEQEFTGFIEVVR